MCLIILTFLCLNFLFNFLIINFFFFFIFAEGLLSYSIPKGVQRGLEVDLSDQTYDGTVEGDRLVYGLGQLVDGQKGTDNFRSDFNGFGKGKSLTPIFRLVHSCQFNSINFDTTIVRLHISIWEFSSILFFFKIKLVLYYYCWWYVIFTH